MTPSDPKGQNRTPTYPTVLVLTSMLDTFLGEEETNDVESGWTHPYYVATQARVSKAAAYLILKGLQERNLVEHRSRVVSGRQRHEYKLTEEGARYALDCLKIYLQKRGKDKARSATHSNELALT